MKKLRRLNKRNCTLLFLLIYSVMVSALAVYLGILNDAYVSQLNNINVDVSYLHFQFDFIQFITDMCIFILIYSIAVIIYSFREGGAKNGKK